MFVLRIRSIHPQPFGDSRVNHGSVAVAAFADASGGFDAVFGADAGGLAWCLNLPRSARAQKASGIAKSGPKLPDPERGLHRTGTSLREIVAGLRKTGPFLCNPGAVLINPAPVLRKIPTKLCKTGPFSLKSEQYCV